MLSIELKDDKLSSLEEITIARIKEHAIVLSGEINEYCNLFRDRLRNGVVLGYKDRIAKLYYDMAYANYNYYSKGLVKDNLLSVKFYLEKSIHQFDDKHRISNNFNIVKVAKYFLDSTCDLYLTPTLELNKLPSIPGNAVVLVKTEDENEYMSFFVENGQWVKEDADFKRVRIQNVNLESISVSNPCGLVHNNEENSKRIERITSEAQLQRGRASINVKYYSLKRKRKKLEENLKRTTETPSEDSSQLFVCEILSKLIECNLEIGCLDQVEYYINLFRNASRQDFEDKLNEYQLRKELIVKLRYVMEFEAALSLSQEDDVAYFLVRKSENTSDYNRELEKWQNIYRISDSRSILFISNSQQNENHWESWFWIPDRIREFLKLEISENSLLSKILNRNRVATHFFGEFLDVLAEKDVFLNFDSNSKLKNILLKNDQFDLKSKRTKIIHFCDSLRKAYQFIGHYPLEQRYHRAMCYFVEEKSKILKQISSSYKISDNLLNSRQEKESSRLVVKQQNDFPLSLFPISSGTGVKKLNDKISEKDFFVDILPYIDQVNDLKRSLNSVYNIDWRFCCSQNTRETCLQNRHEENPYKKKFLFLLMECDFYVVLEVNKKNPPKINGNAIVLTKIENSSNYSSYFIKNGLWLKDNRIKSLKTIVLKSINLEHVELDKKPQLIDKNKFQDQESRIEMERIASEMNLNRWYFYGETLCGRISEGFVDQKQELDILQIYLKDILPEDLKKEKTEIFLQKEAKILNHLSRIFQIDNKKLSVSQDYFIKPMPIIDYENQYSANTGIKIYDLRNSDHGNDLKNRIKSDLSRNFTSIVRLTNKHYVTLFVESKRSYKYNYDLRYIYVMNSALENVNLKILNWFSGVMNQCVYKLCLVECPKQRIMSDDSLLHAYFNAAACQWASNNCCWEFLRKNLARQEFSSKENVEKVKLWFIETSEKSSVLNYLENDFPPDETIEIVEKFKSQFSKLIETSLNSLGAEEIKNRVEYLPTIFATIRRFDEIFESICLIDEKEIPNEIEQCIHDIEIALNNVEEKKKQYLEVNSTVDIMFGVLKKCSLNLLSFQEKLCQNFERFEDRLHHMILLTMTEENNSVSENQSFAHVKQLNSMIERPRPSSDEYLYLCHYQKFVESFEHFLKIENSFSHAQELLSECKSIKNSLGNGRIENAAITNRFAEKSFGVILPFIQRFVKVEESLNEFHQIFKCLLPYCYELLDLPIINSSLRDDIYNQICHQQQNFEDIKKCISALFVKVERKKAFDQEKLTDIFKSFDDCITSNDERAIHYIGAYVRTSMMNTVDYYMNSLASFRHRSLSAMEIFEKSLHRFLLSSIRETVKTQTTHNQLSSRALSYFDSKNVDYDTKISQYKNLLEFLASDNSTILSEAISSLKAQLEDTSHSHFVYLDRKIVDLTNLLSRFANVEECLPKFSELFRQSLHDRYDHLSEQEAFSVDGEINKEIFDRLKPTKNFDDIEQILKIFKNKNLFDIVTKCKRFLEYNDEKGSAEISECLRQCIIDTVEDYVSNLLAFRHRASVGFNHFEISFYQMLSSCEAIKNEKLRSWLKQILIRLNDSNDNYYDYLSIYKTMINYLDREGYEWARLLKDILEEKNHTLKPLFKEKINNLKKLLNGYINWCQIETYKQCEYGIFQIKTNSGVLSQILNVIKEQHPDCFCPNNEIRIINTDKLYIDVDLSSRDYSGVNIVLISPSQELIENKGKLNIITDGEDAKNIWINHPAKNAHGTNPSGHGNKGEDGFDGKSGKSAGHVYVVANQLPPIEVSACGGKGEQGQDGGNGARGLDGKDGKDADKEALRKELSGEWAFLGGAWSYRYRRIGTDGTPGGCGGDAGSGGFCGDGGIPGLVKLVALNETSSQMQHKNFVEKSESENGKPGQPGEAGKHGKDGRDYVAISNYIGLHRALFTSRNVDNLKGGRLYLSDRYEHKEKKDLEDYSMLQFEDDADSFRFKNKYPDRNAQRGATLTHQHKDQEVVQKIHAINHHHVFQQVSQFFDEYINPQKLASYQHWLAPSLKEFLEKMADLEEFPSYTVHTLPDIEHDAKQILILKEKFVRTISRENQRHQTERLDTDQMNIGVILLAQHVLNHHNDFSKQYQVVYQQLQNEIQKVDTSQLATGLEIRSVEIANLRSTINRIINEQRFSRRLLALRKRTEVLVELPQEELLKSISDRQNIKIIKENLYKQEWRHFPIEHNIVSVELIKKFNDEPSEESLLNLGFDYFAQLEKILSQNATLDLDLNQISNFTYTYLYNLQQANHDLLGLRALDDQQRILHQIFIKFPSLDNSHTLDLLIDFSQGIQRECVRHYWLIWIQKTLANAQEFSHENVREMKKSLLNIIEIIRIADGNQLEQIDTKLKSLSILKEFPLYNFDQKLYSNNRAELMKSIDKFNKISDQLNLLEVFQIFSSSAFFDENLSDLLTNDEQLDIIEDFTFIFQHNLALIKIDKNNFGKLTQQIEKIEYVLLQNPRSYLYDIFFDFSCNIEKIKVLDQIQQSNDLNFHSSKPYEANNSLYTIEQQIDAFNTLYDPTLIEEIVKTLSISQDISSVIENNKLIGFLQWAANNLENFKDSTLKTISHTIETILQTTANNSTLSSELKFLKIVFDYKITKLEIEKQEEKLKSTKVDTENILSSLSEINSLFRKISQQTDKKPDKVAELYDQLMRLIRHANSDTFLGVADDQLNEIKSSYEETLKNVSKEIEIEKIFDIFDSSEQKGEIEKNIKITSNHLREKIDLINKQQNDNIIFNDKKLILIAQDKLFSNLDNIDDDMRILITNRLNKIDTKSDETLFSITKELLQESNFCLFVYEMRKNINIGLIQNLEISQLLENELEKLFLHHRKDNNDIELQAISILNLAEFSPEENTNDFLKETIENLGTVKNSETLLNLREQVLRTLIKYYNEKLVSFETQMEKNLSVEEKIKVSEVILIFLHQQSNKKSIILQEIYDRFYEIYENPVSSYSIMRRGRIPFKTLINLMKLISRVHQDNVVSNDINIVHAQFQITLLHVVLEQGNPLGSIDDQFVDFLAWLLQTLSAYESIENLCKNKSHENINEYTYLRKSILSIYQELKIVYLEKYSTALFEKYSNAKWLEIVIYFPEFFEEDNDELFDFIVKNSTVFDMRKIDEIQEIIFTRIFALQRKKLEKFYELVPIENGFKELNGYIQSGCSFDKKKPYEVLNFNNLIDTFNNRLEMDGGLSMNVDNFIKVQQCLSCFEDIRVAIEKLSSSPQTDWLRILLIEHIVEKYTLIFSPGSQIENLRNMLMRVNEKILLLFNNMFMSHYIDQINQAIYSQSNIPSIPDYQKMTKEKFLSIVELMGKISVSKERLDQLSDASLAVWDILLHEIEFSQIFTREMTKSGIQMNEDGVEKALLFLNRIRIQLGIENNDRFLNFFLSISDKIAKTTVKTVEQLNKLLEVVHYENISFEQANEIVEKFNYLDWPDEIKKIVSSRFAIDNKSDRSAREIIDQMINQQNKKTNVIVNKTLESIAHEAKRFREKALKKTVLEGNENSEINREIQETLNLKSYQDNPEKYVRSHLDQIIPLILYAWSIANKPQFPKDTQIVALLLVIHSHDKGLLEQVRTGEGKTLIVGLIAAFLALCGHAVDIVSSNRDLAIEGEQKCRSFFQLLKLESGHICSENDEVNHQSYRSDLNTSQGNIVYGEVGTFQRDILEEEFNSKKIFGKRYENRNKSLIVDEVDNMCLDKARHVLYLSHEIESLKWLETLFINIWAAVLRTEMSNSDDISEHIKDISQFIKANVQNKNISVPDYMNEFVNYKIERWVDSAFQARIMREDDHFVLDIPKTDDQHIKKQKNIIVLDKDTGIEQYSTRWSHGLAQFLELKYRRKITVESLKAVFISNKAFFQRYKQRLYGLTGTLGSENSQSFLSDLYHVQFADLPTSRKKSYFQLPSKVSFEYGDWLDLIAKESIEQAHERPVLVICENVEATENIWNELIRHGVPPHRIEKYRRDGDNVEERFRQQPATVGDIIIATNKGGRGTDIHVDSHVNSNGGMHVILSYLPENVRVEEQAFGRTARNGAAGTGQFILQVDKSIYENMYELNQYPDNQRQKKLEDLSDIILEREKIQRDNKEAARLSDLKQKSILRLEVEEELFDKFNQFKKKISKEIFKPLFNDRSEKSKEKFLEVFENILKNRWAFWLDKVKNSIDDIETSQGKNILLNQFDSSFIKAIADVLQKTNFDSLLEKFIEKPEEAVQIGKVCLSEDEVLMAKKCFEKGITYGDVSGFSYMGLVFCIIKLKEEGNIRKQSRRELKKALRSLEAIKRNLMANLKIAEMLPQSATADILKKVSSKENFYQDQISGKLEVIGLHIHYLKKAIGETVEPFDFILNAKEGEKFTEENYERGEKLYDLLVQGGLIQGDRIRKVLRKEKGHIEKTIRDNIDPSIADSLISLLNRKNEFEKNDFENIVCYNEQLWEVLNVKTFQTVFILDKNRIEKQLPEEYESIWKDLEDKIDPNQVDISIFEESSEKMKFKIYLEKKKILVQTKRVHINELDFDSLRFDGEFKKYSKMKFNDNGYETKDLKEFLIELKEYISQGGSEYFYQTDLPFGTKEEEGNKIRIFLKEKNIIKSGGLALYKYGDNRDEIDKSLDKILAKSGFENDKQMIQSILASLQGDIRSYKDDLKVNLKDFLDLQDQEEVPSELAFFEGSGLNKFLIIEEDKSWWDWNAFAVAMIGVAEVIGGTILIACGAVNIGGALLSEGIADMIYATMAGLSGQFSWKDWAIQKSISFSLSLMTAGIGKLASVGSTAAKIGSLSKAAMFAKIIKSAACDFATICLTNILTEKIMEQIKDGVIPMIVNGIEENFLKGIFNSINTKVRNLYVASENDSEFEKSCSEMKNNIDGALGKSIILPQQFDNIRIQVVSTLQNSYQQFAAGLANSSSKYAKMTAAAIKATSMINRIWTAVQSVLQLTSAISTVTKIVDGAINTEEKNVNSKVMKDALIKARVDQLISIIKGYISSKLTKELEKILRQIISGTLKQIGKAMAQIAKAMGNGEVNEKNPINKMKNANQNKDNDRNSQVIVEQPSTDQSSQNEQRNKDKREDLQNNIKNPKEMNEGCLNDINKKSSGATDRADIKMLANSKWRNITVHNQATGETEVIRPGGLRKIPAFFKQSAEIIFQPGENGSIGHFVTARGKETYIQLNGRQDCLLIAYHESLGRKVNEAMIEKERYNLDQYITRNRTTYSKYKQNMIESTLDPMIAGRQKEKRDLENDEATKDENKKRNARPKKEGTYGNKPREKSRLKQEHGITVSGQTHEFEHPIPWATLAADADPALKIQRKGGVGEKLEAISPAYAETKSSHKEHPGTGRSNEAVQYRSQLGVALKEDKSPGNAFQISLVEYAQKPNFIDTAHTPVGIVASDSYQHMIMNTDSVPYLNNDASFAFMPLDNHQKKECIVARWIADNGKYPTESETEEIIRAAFKRR
ncbi:unnamed protein product [Rotaria socialis]